MICCDVRGVVNLNPTKHTEQGNGQSKQSDVILRTCTYAAWRSEGFESVNSLML